MRRIALAAVLLMLAGQGAVAAPSPPGSLVVYRDPGDAVFMSPNISYVGTIPVDSPGVAARLLQVGGQKRLYVTGVTGLTIYEVSDPALPTVLGHLQLPNWENEDVDVSKDGKTVLISEFNGTYMHVVQVDDLPGGLLAPRPVGFIACCAGHIVSCVDDACNWVYGSEGTIIDLRNKTAPTSVGNWATMTGLPTSGHNIERDATGLVWTDTTPIGVLDVTDPQKPRRLALSRTQDHAGKATAYQHNNIRPRAAQYDPRDTEEEKADPNFRPGELLFGNGETNFTGTCNSGSGPFAIWDLRNFDATGAQPFRALKVFRPVSGAYTNGDPSVNALGCSGHWFTTRSDGDFEIVAAGWYEHGTRLLKINTKTADLQQIGFYQPVVGSASAAYWVNDEYIYVVDYERGIDILRYDKTKAVPTQAEFDASWMAKADAVSPAAEAERYFCRIGRFARG